MSEEQMTIEEVIAQQSEKVTARERIARVVNNNARIAEAGRKVLEAIDKDPSLDENIAIVFGIIKL